MRKNATGMYSLCMTKQRCVCGSQQGGVITILPIPIRLCKIYMKCLAGRGQGVGGGGVGGGVFQLPLWLPIQPVFMSLACNTS